MEQYENQIVLRGDLLGMPEFSHENHGKRFCRFFLEVPRLSGAVDTLPVVAREELTASFSLSPGIRLSIQGQIRSHNHTDELGRHLMIFVFASSLYPEDGEPINDASVTGLLCREPNFRRTPLGREICDAMLAVPRAYKRADYLPCILWGRVAKEISQCPLRDTISIRGRLQSRIYTKYIDDIPVERTAYELSALTAAVIE